MNGVKLTNNNQLSCLEQNKLNKFRLEKYQWHGYYLYGLIWAEYLDDPLKAQSASEVATDQDTSGSIVMALIQEGGRLKRGQQQQLLLFATIFQLKKK